jgi:hypothetical protein
MPKCNEGRPTCGSCERYQVACVYGSNQSSPSAEQALTEPKGPSRKSPVGGDPIEPDSLESKERRVLELKLLHHYVVKTSWSLLEPTEPTMKDLWTVILPELAFCHDTILYLIYSLSALHLARTNPRDGDALGAYPHYLGLALRQHHRDINQMSKANADIICLSASLIRIDAFAQLQSRSLEPYIPPVQWFQLTKGASSAFRAAWTHIATNENSIAAALIKRTPSLQNVNQLFGAQNRQGLLHLLQQNPAEGSVGSEPPWDSQVQDAYESTCSYIGSIQIAIKENETPADICRRLLLFPIMVQERFIGLLGELQPRALVILAHFFALLVGYRDVWWIGEAGQKEIRGIQSVLPREWQSLMIGS